MEQRKAWELQQEMVQLREILMSVQLNKDLAHRIAALPKREAAGEPPRSHVKDRSHNHSTTGKASTGRTKGQAVAARAQSTRAVDPIRELDVRNPDREKAAKADLRADREAALHAGLGFSA